MMCRWTLSNVQTDLPPPSQGKSRVLYGPPKGICGVWNKITVHTPKPNSSSFSLQQHLISQIRVLCVVIIYHDPLREDDAFVLEAEVLTVL